MMLHLLTKETAAAMTLDFDRRRDVCGDSAALLQLHAAVLVHAQQPSSDWRWRQDILHFFF